MNPQSDYWLRRLAGYVVAELRSVARLQWLIMTLAALIVLPWTYRSLWLASWTAKLNYFQYCKANVVRNRSIALPVLKRMLMIKSFQESLTGSFKRKCEMVIQNGVGPPPERPFFQFSGPDPSGLHSLPIHCAPVRSQKSCPTILPPDAMHEELDIPWSEAQSDQKVIPIFEASSAAMDKGYYRASNSSQKLHKARLSEYQQEGCLFHRPAPQNLEWGLDLDYFTHTLLVLVVTLYLLGFQPSFISKGKGMTKRESTVIRKSERPQEG